MYNMQLHYDNRYVQRIQKLATLWVLDRFFSLSCVYFCVYVCLCVLLNFLIEEVSFKLLINQCVSYFPELGTLM